MLSYIVILHQTTTCLHNSISVFLLSYIVILHQTTTPCVIYFFVVMLSYIVILHQTTTFFILLWILLCCHISLFYIKPQRHRDTAIPARVVIYRYSTSNHNRRMVMRRLISLSYIVILHQTTTYPRTASTLLCCHISLFYIKPQLDIFFDIFSSCCHISLFYIKPQLSLDPDCQLHVVIYRYSTSNHNLIVHIDTNYLLSYIVILHQTTTRRWSLSS